MAQCDTRAMPPLVQILLKRLNECLPETLQVNHGIYTYYENGDDSIGAHSDKTKSFAPKSWFIVIKLGATRYFDFDDLEENKLFHEKLTAGTALFVRSDTANVLTKHSVPVTTEKIGPSASIVFRRIVQRVPWKQQEKLSNKAREKKINKNS